MAGRSRGGGRGARESERVRRRLALAQRAAGEAQPKDWLHVLAGDFAHVVGGFACVQGAAMLGTGSRALRVAHEKVVRGMNADLPADDRVAIVPREGGGATGMRNASRTMKAVRKQAGLYRELYVMGGCDDDYRLNTMVCYDPKTKQWSTLPPMPTARDSPGAAVLEGKLYVVGGEDADNHTHNTVECYDPKTKQWSTLPPMATARYAMGTAVL